MPEETTVTTLADRIQRLEILLKISRQMNATANQESLITNIASEVATYLKAERCSIFFYDSLTEELYTHLATGLSKGQEIRIPSNLGIAGHVFQTGEIKNVADVRLEPLFTGVADKETGFQTRNMLAYPLVNRRKKTIGVFQLLNKHAEPGNFTRDDEAFLNELVTQISDLLDLILRKDELSQRNAVLEAQLDQLGSLEYLIEDRTVINTVFKYNRKVHYWGGVIGLVILILMSITSLVMVRSHDWRSLMVGMHTGTAYGLGFRYYYFTDTAAIITLVICISGVLMYAYPPLNRWLKAKKDLMSKQLLQKGIRQMNRARRVQEGLRKVLQGKDDSGGNA